MDREVAGFQYGLFQETTLLRFSIDHRIVVVQFFLREINRALLVISVKLVFFFINVIPINYDNSKNIFIHIELDFKIKNN